MPPSYPLLDSALLSALGLYALALLLVLVRPAWGRVPLLLGAGLHLAATVGRGVIVGFLPLSNKMESFSAFALCMAAVSLWTWRPTRAYLLPMLAVTVAGMGTAVSFGLTQVWPVALLLTVWYPLHVPLSFLAYALWVAAGAAGLAWLTSGRDAAWLHRVDHLALQGLAVWTLSMFFGGIWGVVAWGSSFLWDAKLIWSVLLWFHYASFVHIKLSPELSRRPALRPLLAWLGVGWVFVAYVGTSFFFGGSSHAF